MSNTGALQGTTYTDGNIVDTNRPRRLLRRIGAVLAGLLTIFIVTTVTDVVLHATGVFPAWGQPMTDALFLLATAYRIVFGVAGSYITARLAPDRPMQHALVLGIVGVVLSTAGAVAMWDLGITSFYKHPIEVLLNGLISSVVLYVVVGLGPEAGAYAMLANGMAELLYHWNVNTPAWLGYVIQRPESHCVHHQERLHRYNYADLPVFDLLFRTFRNPAKWAGNCGLGPEGTRRLGAMLVGRDVTREGSE